MGSLNCKVIILFFLVIASIQACRHDPVIPTENPISFNDRVLPIIKSNCATSGCHDASGEFSLETFDEVRSITIPGKAHQSELYQRITMLNGEEAMPPQSPLSEQQIELIYTWIMQGAKNN